jgi:predicted amidophosphoribosyltransferase
VSPPGPSPAPFVWPPRSPGPDDAADPVPHTPAPTRSDTVALPAWRRVTREVERTWLCPVREPIEWRMAARSWAPDAFDAYCDRCGAGVGVGEADEFGCAECRGRRFPWERLVRLGAYAAPLDEWVREIKFSAERRTARALGTALGRRLRDAGALRAGAVAVVPVATPWIRRVRRGVDHTSSLARAASGELGAACRRALRARERPSQRSLPPSGREANVRGVFRARWRRSWGEPGVIVVIDDVATSGSTLRAACRALRASAPTGATLWAATVARAEDPGRRDHAARRTPDA